MVHAFTGETLGLAVERLVLPILLEQQHGEEAWARPATRHDMEWRGRLRDLLAVTAGELLAYGLDAFGTGAALLAPELGDLQLVVRDQCLGGALPGTDIGQFGLGGGGALFGRIGALRAEPDQRLEHFNVVRQGRNGGVHNQDGITENRPVEAENAASTKEIRAYPALWGRQLYCGFRQSTPSSK